MHKEPDTAGPQWVPLQEAAERLSRDHGLYTKFTLNEILARGHVPVLATRSDVLTKMPDRVEGLLAKAARIAVISHNNAILAHYRLFSEQEADRLLGPRSNWRFANPDSPLNADPDLRWLPLNFDQVRVCWTTLMREMQLVGWGPSDEAPDGAEPPGDTPGPAPAAEIHKAIPHPTLVKHLKAIKANGGPVPARDLLHVDVVKAFPKFRVTRDDVRKVAEEVWGEQPPGRRRKSAT